MLAKLPVERSHADRCVFCDGLQVESVERVLLHPGIVGCSGCSASAGAACSMYCAWPPSRHAGITTRRAVRPARSGPACWRIRCRHKSRPDATPADVRTEPSSTNRTPGSTSISGYRRASSPAHCQCVVARLPSSRPAAASVKAPTHIAAIRAPLSAAARSARNRLAGQALRGIGGFPAPPRGPLPRGRPSRRTFESRPCPSRAVVLIDGRCPHTRTSYSGSAPSGFTTPGSAAARLAMPKTWPGIISSNPMTCSSASTPTIIVARS